MSDWGSPCSLDRKTALYLLNHQRFCIYGIVHYFVGKQMVLFMAIILMSLGDAVCSFVCLISVAVRRCFGGSPFFTLLWRWVLVCCCQGISHIYSVSHF